MGTGCALTALLSESMKLTALHAHQGALSHRAEQRHAWSTEGMRTGMGGECDTRWAGESDVWQVLVNESVRCSDRACGDLLL